MLMGTLLEIEGNALTMVATDGYRLAKFATTLDDGISGSEKYIVPSRALAEVARNLGGGETIAVSALGAQSNQLQMTAGSVSITVRLVDGQYPNYQQVIPAKFDRTMTVNTSALIGSLRRAELVAGDRASMVKLAMSNQTLVVTASSRYIRHRIRRARNRADGRGSHHRIQRAIFGRNSQPRQERETVVEFLGPLSPAAIRPLEPLDSGQQLYVLMPLRQ